VPGEVRRIVRFNWLSRRVSSFLLRTLHLALHLVQRSKKHRNRTLSLWNHRKIDPQSLSSRRKANIFEQFARYSITRCFSSNQRVFRLGFHGNFSFFRANYRNFTIKTSKSGFLSNQTQDSIESSWKLEEISENLNILIANVGFRQVFDEIFREKSKKKISSARLFNELIKLKNEKWIRFCANFLSAQYRIQFWFYAKDYLDIILEEIEKNQEMKQENFVEILLEFEPVQQRTVEPMLLLINAENLLKLK